MKSTTKYQRLQSALKLLGLKLIVKVDQPEQTLKQGSVNERALFFMVPEIASIDSNPRNQSNWVNNLDNRFLIEFSPMNKVTDIVEQLWKQFATQKVAFIVSHYNSKKKDNKYYTAYEFDGKHFVPQQTE